MELRGGLGINWMCRVTDMEVVGMEIVYKRLELMKYDVTLYSSLRYRYHTLYWQYSVDRLMRHHLGLTEA